MKPLIPQTITAVSIVALALAVSGCGGSSKSKMAETMEPMEPEQTPQEECEADGGRWNADMTCTSAAAVEAERMMMAAKAKRIAAAIGPTPVAADADPGTGGIQYPFTSDGTMFAELPATSDDSDDDFAMSEMGPAAITGFDGTMHTRQTTEDDKATMDTNESVMDEVVSYTDEMAKTAEEYQDYYASGAAGEGLAGIDSITDNDAGNVITFAADVSSVSMHIDVAKFPSVEHQTLTFDDDPDTTGDDEDENALMGNYHGVPGTYNCGGTTAGVCTVTTNSDGEITTLGGTWTFTPDELEEDADAYMVAGVTRDPDYLTFGYWVRTFYNEDGEMAYAFSAFADGARDYGDVSSVEGTAEYSGSATGLYMIKDFASDGKKSPRTGGQFTADVMLMANFGGDDVARSLQNSISGTIDNFMDAYGNSIDDSWMVKLNRGDNTDDDMDMNDAANIGTSDGAITGTTMGMGSGGNGTAGTWSGMLHGADDTTTTAVNEPPNSVSGMFDAHFTNGHARGAFGANMVEEDDN